MTKSMLCPCVYSDATFALIRLTDTDVGIIPYATSALYAKRHNKWALATVAEGDLRFVGNTEILTTSIKKRVKEYFMTVRGRK